MENCNDIFNRYYWKLFHFMIAPIKNISFVPENDLCHSCGVCSAVCPLDCIEMVRGDIQDIPTVDFDICTDCDLCVKACSGYSTNSLENIDLNKKKSYPGKYEKAFVGYSLNDNNRLNSASGGVMTEFASFLLREKKVDGVLATMMGEDGYPKSFIAYDEKDLLKCRGSIYEVNNISKPLEEILNSKDKTFAVIALPCQLESLEKASKFKKKLKRIIKYKISLFCGKTISHKGVDFLLDKVAISREENYRYRTMPGWGVRFGNKVNKVEFWNTFINPGMFELNRCDLCSDFYGKHADIVFGDAWLPEYKDDTKGVSIILARKDNALDVLNEMVSKEIIFTDEITNEKVIESQGLNSYYKFKSMPTKTKVREKFSKQTPYENIGSSQSTVKDQLYVLRKYFIMNYFKTKKVKHILKHESLYLFIVKVLRKLFKEGKK